MKHKKANLAVLKRELAEYEQRTQMTAPERRKLRDWVSSGHSVYENPGSDYLCDFMLTNYNFLEVNRLDTWLEQELAGKTLTEQGIYLKKFMGYTDSPVMPVQRTIDQLKDRIRQLERDLFHLFMFTGQEGLWEEAHSFVEEYKDEPIPFEDPL